MKLTGEQSEAVVRLQGNKDFHAIVDAMNAYRHESIEFAMFGPVAEKPTYCGIARGVTEVLRALGSSTTVSTKSRGRI